VRSPTLEREGELWARGHRIIAGVDEVGRGPVAGPVVAAAVVLNPGQSPLDDLRDSKLMTPRRRARVADVIRRTALTWGVGAASVHEIDRLNIRRATALAMQRALAHLSIQPDHILLDGTPLPELGLEHEAVVGGDGACQSIAAAAVVAKVVRDDLMIKLAQRYPGFAWHENKGYATRAHLEAIDQEGPTPHHRSTFAPVVQMRLW
jgi:ribonuclease HII